MTLFATLIALLTPGQAEPKDVAAKPFAIQVVDEQTGRGVPLVELRTVHNVLLLTDSAGVAAFSEPGLMGRDVFFHVRSHGYEFAKDGFGIRGKALKVEPGGLATLKIKRINIAERLYRVTGGGIYRDSLLTGHPSPIKEPLLNAQVIGQDSVVNAIFQGKLHWFWGDTIRPSYPLGNFHVPGATSALPGPGGLDPDGGVDLTYYVDDKGFARPTCQMPGEGPTWIFGLTAFKDKSGKERMFAGYMKVKPPLQVYERGLAEFRGETQKFEKVVAYPEDASAVPTGHTFLHKVNGVEYVYICDPLPFVRVPADPDALRDPRRFEAFSPLAAGGRMKSPTMDRDPFSGRLLYGWKANTSPVGSADATRLVRSGKLQVDEQAVALRDVETGRALVLHAGSCYWNPHRNRWVAIFGQSGGSTSNLGEIWYAEGDTPLGPWVYARKVVTHEHYSLYNPKQHPYMAKGDGRFIYFEGTFSVTFEGNPHPMPLYDYNQIMYKIDLDDARLNLPVAIYNLSTGRLPDTFGPASPKAPGRTGRPVAFFALERPSPATAPIYEVTTPGGGHALSTEAPRGPDGRPAAPLFHAIPGDAQALPVTTMPLNEFVHSDGVHRLYTTEPLFGADGYRRSDKPLCHVWRNPLRIVLPKE